MKIKDEGVINNMFKVGEEMRITTLNGDIVLGLFIGERNKFVILESNNMGKLRTSIINIKGIGKIDALGNDSVEKYARCVKNE